MHRGQISSEESVLRRPVLIAVLGRHDCEMDRTVVKAKPRLVRSSKGHGPAVLKGDATFAARVHRWVYARWLVGMVSLMVAYGHHVGHPRAQLLLLKEEGVPESAKASCVPAHQQHLQTLYYFHGQGLQAAPRTLELTRCLPHARQARSPDQRSLPPGCPSPSAGRRQQQESTPLLGRTRPPHLHQHTCDVEEQVAPASLDPCHTYHT